MDSVIIRLSEIYCNYEMQSNFTSLDWIMLHNLVSDHEFNSHRDQTYLCHHDLDEEVDLLIGRATYCTPASASSTAGHDHLPPEYRWTSLLNFLTEQGARGGIPGKNCEASAKVRCNQNGIHGCMEAPLLPFLF